MTLDIFQGIGLPFTASVLDGIVNALGQNPHALWSVLAVETRGFGYLPDRRPKILFERHVFHNRTGGRFSAAHPDISNPKSGGYLGGAAEYQRLKRAMLLDRIAALESASWGLGQVMGFNASVVGYADVEAMIAAFVASEDAQLRGCADFILAKPALHKAFLNENWDRVAFYYNGKNYKLRSYDVKLGNAYADYKRSGVPKVDIRTAQACLTYLGDNPKGIDGVLGNGTKAALLAFQTRHNRDPKGGSKLPENGALDAATLKALMAAAIPAP